MKCQDQFSTSKRMGFLASVLTKKTSHLVAKFGRSAVKVGGGLTGSSDLDVDECVSIEYQLREVEPDFEVETKDDCFWSPVAH